MAPVQSQPEVVDFLLKSIFSRGTFYKSKISVGISLVLHTGVLHLFFWQFAREGTVFSMTSTCECRHDGWIAFTLHWDHNASSTTCPDWLMIRSAWSDHGDRMLMPSVNAANVTDRKRIRISGSDRQLANHFTNTESTVKSEYFISENSTLVKRWRLWVNTQLPNFSVAKC